MSQLRKITLFDLDPVATNPDDRLRLLATQCGWRILDLFLSEPLVPNDQKIHRQTLW